MACWCFLTCSDSKSGDGDFVPVRFRPSVPNLGFELCKEISGLESFYNSLGHFSLCCTILLNPLVPIRSHRKINHSNTSQQFRHKKASLVAAICVALTRKYFKNQIGSGNIPVSCQTPTSTRHQALCPWIYTTDYSRPEVSCFVETQFQR